MIETLLILGGTADARALADAVLDRWPEMRVITSLAGRTASPRTPRGEINVGGFGGAKGLADFMKRENVRALIDATHPFAAEISKNASDAERMTGRPRLTLMRRPWSYPKGTNVEHVADVAAAQAALGSEDRRVFLAIGRKEITSFPDKPGRFHLLRFVDGMEGPLPFEKCHLLTGRPGSPEEEAKILDDFEIDTLVAKNGGSDLSRGKVDAAVIRGLRVVLIDPPAPPPPPHAETIVAALNWLEGL